MEVDKDFETFTGAIWRHKKTGGFYSLVGVCQIEATNEKGVLYIPTDGSGTIWCRPADEFFDGRFESVVLNSTEDQGKD